MPFQLSPGVAVVEKDFSSIVPAVSSSAGAFAGPFAWGPIEDPVRVSSETELVARFGAPNDSNFQSFFTAANFLAYTNSLYVSRADSANLKNAVAAKTGSIQQENISLTNPGSGYQPPVIEGQPGEIPTVTFSAPNVNGGVTATGQVTYTDVTVNDVTVRQITGVVLTNPGSGYTAPPTITISAPLAGAPGTAATARVTAVDTSGVKIKNISHYLEAFNGGDQPYGQWAAKFAGARGNGLRVVMLDAGNWAAAPSALKLLFTGAPATSSYAAARGISNDEVHVAIFDTATGQFSGVAGSVLEKFSFLSKLTDAKRTDGSNNYYKSVINSQSKYVWWLAHPIAYDEPADVTIAMDAVTVFASVTQNNVTTNTITIGDTAAFDSLAAFKTYYDNAKKKDRQIVVSGSSANNGTYDVVGVTTLVTDDEITAYKIQVVQTLTDETDAESTISNVYKAQWGQNSIDMTQTRMSVLSAVSDITLSGGVNDFEAAESDIENAYAVYNNTDQYDISLIPTGNVSSSVAQFIVNNVAEVRKDCVVFISPNISDDPITSTGSTATDAIIAYRNATNINSSYAVMDSGFKYQYDRYNDAYRWVPLNGDIAGLCARTDYTADPWFSPGGFNRGQIKNIVKLAFNPSQSDRDVLYAAGVNPVVSFPGQGVILYGDKTLLARPSAFDRINVRRLFIVLEKSIAIAAKYQMFEFNDSFTRAQFKNLVEPFLRDVQGRRGVVDFRVKCDETNNTGQVIDSNEFVADIFIKPNRSINFITLNFVAARSSVSFEEIGG